MADQLFATLDTTVRALRPETSPRVLVSDTVGFIKKLPHDLVASFRSTLAEALDASLLLYVVDASDPTHEAQLEVTRSVLHEIGADAVPSVLLLNKMDRVDEAGRAALAEPSTPRLIFLSAASADDVVAAARDDHRLLRSPPWWKTRLTLPIRQAGTDRHRLRERAGAVGGVRCGRPDPARPRPSRRDRPPAQNPLSFVESACVSDSIADADVRPARIAAGANPPVSMSRECLLRKMRHSDRYARDGSTAARLGLAENVAPHLPVVRSFCSPLGRQGHGRRAPWDNQNTIRTRRGNLPGAPDGSSGPNEPSFPPLSP